MPVISLIPLPVAASAADVTEEHYLGMLLRMRLEVFCHADEYFVTEDVCNQLDPMSRPSVKRAPA